MRMYWTGWIAVTVIVAGLGAVIGLLAVPTLAVLGIGAAAVASTYVAGDLVTVTPSGWGRLRWMTQAGLVAIGGALCLLGLAKFMGPAGIVLTALLAATSPPAIVGWRIGVQAVSCLLVPPPPSQPRTSSDCQIPATPAGRGTSRPSIQTLTDAQLCLAWRSSFIALQRSRDLYEQIRLVGTRQEYLDELEHRNPRGFARWLDAGARPASDPSRYMRTTLETQGNPHLRSADTPPSSTGTP